jgi:hypothetical protein
MHGLLLVSSKLTPEGVQIKRLASDLLRWIRDVEAA